MALPSYAADYYSAADRADVDRIRAGEASEWCPIEAERPFDAVAMRVQGRFHIGIVVQRGLMLHMPLRQSSVIVAWQDRFHVEGLFRHKRLL